MSNENVWVRFERGSKDEVSTDIGPFEFVQMTYTELHAPDGAEIGGVNSDGYWQIASEYLEDGKLGVLYSDVVIYSLTE